MQDVSREQPSPAILGHTLLRNVGAVLDECSAQGLQVWPDETGRWYWRWVGTELEGQRGLWAMGEAVVDAVATRFPDYFEFPVMLDGASE